LDVILQLTFPKLKYIELVGAFVMSTQSMPSFLARHPQLEELHMPFEGYEVGEDQEGWRPNEWWLALFQAVRIHQGLRIKSLKFRFMEDGFFGFCMDDEKEAQVYPWKTSPLWCWDLNKYLKDGGKWTKALEEKFGAMV
jgi:hypothetical protein